MPSEPDTCPEVDEVYTEALMTRQSLRLLSEPTASEGRRPSEPPLNAGLWANRQDLAHRPPSDVMEISAGFGTRFRKKNWCVTIATASFQHKLSVPSTHVPLLYFTHTVFAVSSNIRGICSVLSGDSTSKGCPASQSQTQVAHSTTHTDGQTSANLKTDVHLNIPAISPLSPPNTVTVTFNSLMAKKRTTNVRTRTRPWLRLTWHLAQTNRKHQNVFFFFFLNSSFSKSLFTAAWAKGTENKHQTVKKKKKKNTALNTLLGGVSQLADRNKRNRGCTERVEPTWCCHGNHIPRWWWGDQPGEWEQRTGKPTHTNHSTSVCLSLCIFKMKKEKKKKKTKHHGWTAPILMSSIFELAITLAVKMTIQQSAVSFSI